ncbi:Glutaredoxin-related protein [Handroanthus impetiginosus]|uniref:Glutaredoxin-related protein n=1 Tax=Handroanthus impetiginosus TaxID=429701 RepID=A0A2G9G1A7_9LAMI|nr:Glutaredoxin-related protein [Handroanthus impetiginosus]
MGCASSKQKVCRKCQAPYSPVRRSYSMHVHHPPQKVGDSYHLVALTSTTLGSLKLDPLIQTHILEEKDKDEAPIIQNQNQSVVEDNPSIENRGLDRQKSAKEEFEMGMIEAKTWSKMINEKIPKVVPKTPIRTPPGEPETINAWEMMEGLEDISPLRPVHHFRSFSFHVLNNPSLSNVDDQPTPRVRENGDAYPKPAWLELADSDSNSNSNDTSIVSEFDPEVIATFRRALEELPPANPFHLKPLDGGKEPNVDNDMSVSKTAPRGTDKLIVYFTSLRGVRKTYEDCCHVRVILKGLRVKVDERDVSMHSGFKDELKELLGEGVGGSSLPRVFLGKKCIGGADEIRRLNEEGKLEKLVENCELVDDAGGDCGNGNVCEACGDIRFVPCETCSGSCKIYYEGDYEEEEFDESEHEYGFHRCPDCNENGLIRCPICCD